MSVSFPNGVYTIRIVKSPGSPQEVPTKPGKEIGLIKLYIGKFVIMLSTFVLLKNTRRVRVARIDSRVK